MSITNIERMVEALVRDEMNYVKTMSDDGLFRYMENLIREKYESMRDRHIIEEYERIA